MNKTVVFCHGYKGFKDWGPWNQVAEFFVNRGFVFVKFNFSHNGVRDGLGVEFNDLEAFGENNLSTEVNDLGKVLDWLEQTELDGTNGLTRDLNLIGHSRGGGITICRAAEDDRIKRLATWASVSDFSERFPSGEDMIRWKKEGVYHIHNGRTGQEMPHGFQYYEDFRDHRERLDIQKACESLKCKHLVLHGDADETVHLTEAKRIHQWSEGSQLELIPGANHGFGGSHPWGKNSLPAHLKKVCEHTCNFFYEKEPT